MKSINGLILIVVTLVVLAGCAGLPSFRSEHVSGKEGLKEPAHYAKKSKVRYDVFNDDKNVYVSLKASDYYAQVKILRFGLTLWLDEKGKKHKEKGIVFPMESGMKKPAQTPGRGTMTPGGKQGFAQLHSLYELSDKNILLIGFNGKGSKQEIYPKREKYDIDVTITFDSLNILNYLAVIPIEKILSENPDNRSFSIGFESGFLDMSTMSSMMQGGGMRGGGHPGGMGGGRGGGMGGGRGGRGGMKGGVRPGGGSMATMRTALTEPIKVWFATTLTE